MSQSFQILGGFALCALLGATPCVADGWNAQVLRFQVPEVVESEVAPLSGWDARIEYDIAADNVDAARDFASAGEPLTRTVFATVRRHFHGDSSSPYIGIGAGYADALVDAPSLVSGDALAVRGIFGSDFALEEDLEAYIEYGFAVAPGARRDDGGSLRSHGVSTGLRLNLN